MHKISSIQSAFLYGGGQFDDYEEYEEFIISFYGKVFPASCSLP